MEESTPEIQNRIENELAELTVSLSSEMAVATLAESELAGIFERYQSQLKVWCERNKGKADGYEKTKNHFLDLVVWELFANEESSEKQKELLGLVWQRLESAIAFKARPFKNVGVRSSEEDNFDDMMQEAFLRFEGRLRKFDPNNARTSTLKTYISMVYQKLFISIADLRAVKGFDEDVMPEGPQENERSPEAILAIEDREAIEVAIDELQQERPQDAKKFEALKMRVYEGKSNQDVAAALGESESWTSKAVKAMTKKLTSHFSE